jgi:hypothetical protein
VSRAPSAGRPNEFVFLNIDVKISIGYPSFLILLYSQYQAKSPTLGQRFFLTFNLIAAVDDVCEFKNLN